MACCGVGKHYRQSTEFLPVFPRTRVVVYPAIGAATSAGADEILNLPFHPSN